LDFLGDVGGLFGALDPIIAVFATFFSSRFFVMSVAQSLYTRRVTQSESMKQTLSNKPKKKQKSAKFFKKG
jgi:hypothetical protein